MVGKIKLKSSLITSPAAYKRRYGKDDKTMRLGEKAPHDVIHNCMSCSRSFSCKDPNKNFNYRCTRYREATVESTSLEDIFKNEETIDEKALFTPDNPKDQESIFDMISRVIESNLPVPPDLRIKDDEIPTAKNFVEWATDAKFAKSGKTPFPRQIEIGTKLYSEFCPRCSDVDWFDEMPVDAPLQEIQDHVVFLENGICPECKVTRSELIAEGELNNYYGLILLCGQRCVTGDTLITTNYGLVRIEDLIPSNSVEGFNNIIDENLHIVLENGKTIKPSSFYVSKPSHTIKIRTEDGFEIEGTEDHPLMTDYGWISLKDIELGHNLTINIGQNVWSANSDLSIDDAQELAVKFYCNAEETVPIEILQGTETIVCNFLRLVFLQLTYAILNKKALQSIQVLLANLGIRSIIDQIEGQDKYGIITIHEKDVFYFQDRLSNPNSTVRTRNYVSKIVEKTYSDEEKVTYDFEVPEYHRFMANGILNHNSSKTTSAILWDSYNLHKVLKIPNPQDVFNILTTTPITSTFTATTFNQAVANVWNPYLTTIRETPWFRNYHEFLDRRSNELGEELYSLGEHIVRYRHRNVILHPSGPSRRTMRGTSRLTALQDEAGYFKQAKRSKPGEEVEMMDAKGTFDALNNSLITLKQGHRRRVEEGYNDLPKPVMYLPSSPSAFNDFIMTSYRLYKDSTEFLALKHSTWEFNPLYKKEDFAEAFRLKPVETARDYDCNPPIGESLFINQHVSLERAAKHGANKIKIISKKAKSRAKIPVTRAELRLVSNQYPSVGTILCIDVGLTSNSFAFSLIGPHEDYDPEILPEERESMHIPARVYACGEVIPMEDTKISMTSVFADVFVNLIEPFNVKYMVSDRWNNAKIASDLDEGYGVSPIEHKCKWEDFELTRDLLYSDNLHLPKANNSLDDIMKTTLDNYPECFRGSPVDHMLWQFLTVMEKTKVTVLKGDGGTDDLFRTVVLGCAMLQDEEILEDLLSVNAGPVNEPKQFIGLNVGRKGGGMSGASMIAGDGRTLGMVKRR